MNIKTMRHYIIYGMHYKGGSYRFALNSLTSNLVIESYLCILLWSVQEQGILVLTNAIAACTESIEQHKGKLVVKEAPRAVSVNTHYVSLLSYSIF